MRGFAGGAATSRVLDDGVDLPAVAVAAAAPEASCVVLLARRDFVVRPVSNVGRGILSISSGTVTRGIRHGLGAPRSSSVTMPHPFPVEGLREPAREPAADRSLLTSSLPDGNLIRFYDSLPCRRAVNTEVSAAVHHVLSTGHDPRLVRALVGSVRHNGPGRHRSDRRKPSDVVAVTTPAHRAGRTPAQVGHVLPGRHGNRASIPLRPARPVRPGGCADLGAGSRRRGRGRPVRVMDRLGLGAEEIRAVSPCLTHCSMCRSGSPGTGTLCARRGALCSRGARSTQLTISGHARKFGCRNVSRPGMRASPPQGPIGPSCAAWPA